MVAQAHRNGVNVVVTLLDGLPTNPEAMEMYRLLDAMEFAHPGL